GARRDPRRHARGPHLGGPDHGLQVDGARGRGRGRGGARLPASRRERRRHRGRAVIPLAEIEAARERLAGTIVRTPLVKLEIEDAPAEIYLKLENLQPIGSFKLRGAANALALASREELERGVWTASAGNMAQGVAWWAREHGVHCTVVLPESAPEAKIAAIRRLGADMIAVSFEEW